MYTSVWIGITRKRTIQIFIPRPSQSFEMGLRSVLNAWILLVFLWTKSYAAQTYQPPLLLGAPPAPLPAPVQNSYHPPLVGPADSHPVSFQQGSSQSVQYSFPSVSHAQESTSYSVHQQPPSLHSEASGFQQISAERSSHSKAIGSSHVPVQAIHKAPASEIESDKGSVAKEKDNKNDEYVVYYYYYYDNDTLPNNNLSLNFDDIPSLESYDEDKSRKEPQKSASARTLAANVNSLTSTVNDAKQSTDSSSSQPRSASGIDKEAVIKADRQNNNFDDDAGEHVKPVPNIYRYGTNEVPRFPVLHIPEAPSTNRPLDSATPFPAFSDSPTTQQSISNSQFPNVNSDEELEDDAVNNVLDNTAESKSSDRFAEEDTTTVPTTSLPTTTEVPTTTTTEKSRRRPSIGGGRRRFNAAPPSSRTRPPTRSTTSTTTTTTTTSTPTRRSFQGSNRVRPRPSINTNRGRGSSRVTTESGDDQPSSSTESTTVSSTTSRSRFTSAPRRFQSSRTRSQASSATSSSTTTTTSTPRSSTSSTSIRSRPSSRPAPRVNLISRSRPPRPGFIRPRPGSEPEVTEATTSTPEIVETSPAVINEEINNEKSSENDETSEEESEEPTTTEASRFSALFRPRNRSSLGNRPRPVIGNRPSRS